jgi:hypothetical protein
MDNLAFVTAVVSTLVHPKSPVMIHGDLRESLIEFVENAC